MSTLVRWLKFNLAGAVGMVVQLAALAVLNRWLPGHMLCATAAALELTLLHNFVWHVHYTWRDRRPQDPLSSTAQSSQLMAFNGTPLSSPTDTSNRLRQLLRFHLSSGVVSLAGNLVLMQLLATHAHLPLLISNAIAILCCSVANFCLAHRWAFGPAVEESGTAIVLPANSTTIVS